MPIILMQRILIDAVLDIFYFPIWWYTAGAKHTLLSVWEMIKFGNGNMAPGIWLKNIFVPMYGQHDIPGRIISFLIRLIQIIIRTVGLFIWFVICMCLFLVWLAIPIVTVLGLLRTIF